MKSNIRRYAAVMALGAIGVGALAGCGGDTGESSDGGGKSSESAVKVEMKEYQFIPPALTATAGAPITVEATNKGTMEHDFTIEGHEDAKIAVPTPGATVSGTYNLAAGTYNVFCSVPGHKESGMVGTLTVK